MDEVTEWIRWLWEGMQGLRFEQWALLISLLVGAGALYYARRGARSGERSVEEAARAREVAERSIAVAGEQLELARKQDEMQPALEVDLRLLELRNIEAMTNVVRRQLGAVPRGDYSGPSPNKFIQAVVVNVGSKAAYEVTGWLSFDMAYWEPLPYFAEDIAIKDIHIIGDVSDGRLRRQVQVGGRDNVLRPSRNDSLSFFVALLVQSSGHTKIFYEFTALGGVRREGHLQLTERDF